MNIEGAAQRLSSSLNEPVNERDIFQLCADKQLKISVFFPEVVASYSQGRKFSPCFKDSFINEFEDCLELVYMKKHEIDVVDLIDFDISSLEDGELEELIEESYNIIYSWYDKDTNTASYEEEYILEGLHEVISDKNPRFFQWLNELALNNPNFIYLGDCHTGRLTFYTVDDYVEVIFQQKKLGDLRLNPLKVFIDNNYGQRRHQMYNPKLSELSNLLVIQTKHLIEFEQSLLDLEYQKNLVPTPSYIDPLNTYYAKELAIAIEAHTAIFINGEGNKHKATGERVKTWVSEHYPNESKSGAFVDRISSVVLPKKTT